MRIDYFFDPLCGWCYASASALAGLAERYGAELVMRSSGLFMAPRPVSAIADDAWGMDQRFAALTGEVFSQAYSDKVLRVPGGVFSSRLLTLALQALGEIDKDLEPRFLHAAQRARNVRAQDTSLLAPVVEVTRDLMQREGGPLDAALGDRLMPDRGLAERLDARVAETNRMQEDLPRGVPLLRAVHGDRQLVLNGEEIYRGAAPVLERLAAFQ
jgi:putative protein-disulfide isomerase